MLFPQIVFILAVQVCDVTLKLSFTCSLDICHYLRTSYDDEGSYCENTIWASTRLVVSKGASLDYRKYFGRTLKMIEFDDYDIYYDCPDHRNFMYHRTVCYHPSQVHLMKDEHLSTFTFGSTDLSFQNCLKYYCSTLLNFSTFQTKFECRNNNITQLHFQINKLVTDPCLQSMTYIHISSSALMKIDEIFFEFAVNVINLKLETSALLKKIDCDTFVLNSKLRLLNLPNIDISYTYCFFKTNPNLVRISNSTARLWNMCNGTFDLIVDVEVDVESEVEGEVEVEVNVTTMRMRNATSEINGSITWNSISSSLVLLSILVHWLAKEAWQ